MEVSLEQKDEIEEIIGKMDCPKDFICYKSGFEELPKSGITGRIGFVECLTDSEESCRFGIASGKNRRLCQCPLRYYIAENFHV